MECGGFVEIPEDMEFVESYYLSLDGTLTKCLKLVKKEELV